MQPNDHPTQPLGEPQLLSASKFKGRDMQQPPFEGLTNKATSEIIGSEFQSTSFRLSPSTYAPSSAGSLSIVGGLGFMGPFEVPPAPELGSTDKEKMCPYCCLVHPAKIFSLEKKSRRWKKHLLEDLQPYICLFSNCDQLGKTHRSFKDWQAHLSQPHDQDWTCRLQHPGVDKAQGQPFLFGAAAQFQEHLSLYHPDLDSSTTHGIFQVARRPAMISRCFVCGAEQTTAVTLERHVANHLEQKFLLALPGRDDIKDCDTVSSGRPSSGTALTGTVAPENPDLPDLHGLYEDDSDGGAIVNQTLPDEDFSAQLSISNLESASAQDRGHLLEDWNSKLLAVQDSVEVKHDGRTPLSWAAENGFLEVVETRKVLKYTICLLVRQQYAILSASPTSTHPDSFALSTQVIPSITQRETMTKGIIIIRTKFAWHMSSCCSTR